MLPPDYPFKPPHILFLTPSGRFETNTKICLSFSAYHPELWQPAWGIRLILEALCSFLPSPADGAIGALEWTGKERQALAKKSASWVCPSCGPICNLIPAEGSIKKKGGDSRFAKEIAQLQQLQQQQHAKNDGKKDEGRDSEDKERAITDDENEAQSNEQEGATLAGEDTRKTSLAVAESPTKPASTSRRSKRDVEPIIEPEHSDSDNVVSEQSQSEIHVESEYSHLEGPSLAPPPPPQPQSTTWEILLQMMIVVLSIVFYFLLTKVQSLVSELLVLEDELEALRSGGGASSSMATASAGHAHLEL